MPRNHIIISGTGRAGTTFLVQLLTELGLDTGFKDPYEQIYTNANAGMEKDILAQDAPYIVKSPWLSDNLGNLIDEGGIVIDCAIIPIRDLYSAAESRRDVMRREESKKYNSNGVPGGLVHTANPDDQEFFLMNQFYHIVYDLIDHDVPTVFLHFPRLVMDVEYLYSKLFPLFKFEDKRTFIEAFKKLSKPELVHSFESNLAESHKIKPVNFLLENRKLMGEMELYRKYYENIVTSQSYKVGHLLTFPLRKLKALKKRLFPGKI
ncbi:MAG: hypothetical protein ABSF43_01745 [Rectinemataceae bacterium]